MRRRPLAAVIAAFLVVIAASSTSPAHAAPASGSASTSSAPAPGGKTKLGAKATFGIGPNTANASGFFAYQTAPGGSYVDKAVITNYSHFPLTLQVYQASLGNSADGGIAVSKTGQPLTDAGTWIALPTGLRQVRVAAATSKGVGRTAVPFQLSVPQGAEPGDHAAAIVASLVTLGKNPRGQNVRLEQRIAARVYVRVDGPLHPALEVQNVSATYHGTLNPVGRGTAKVTYTVQNTGNARVSLEQAVSVTGLFGTSAQASGSGKVPVLFPGSSLTFTRTVTGVFPTVFEKAQVIVKPVVLSGSKPAPMASVTATGSFTAIPWVLLGIVALLLVLAVVLFVLRRRGRASGRTRSAKHGSTKTAAARKPRGRPAGEMSRVARRAGYRTVAGACALLFAAVSLSVGGPARADTTVPFTDPSVKGYLGFCDAAGKQITSGNLSDVPFVYRAVSSAPTPAGFTVGAGAKATLYAYLPMKGVDPGDWSGQALTGSAFFNNPKHPMSEGTVLDYSIGSFAQQVTVYWNNLIQLRMFIGEPNKATYTSTYPAAVIQVTGSTWHVVQGGPVDCAGGKTKALESLALPASKFSSASASVAAASKSAAVKASSAAGGSGAATGSSGSSGSSGSAGSAGTTSASGRPSASIAPAGSSGSSATPSGSAATGSNAVAGSPSSSASGGSSWPLVVAVAAAGVLVAGAVFWLLRRRRPGSSV